MQHFCANRFIRFPNVISLLIIEQFNIHVNKQKSLLIIEKPCHINI